MNIPYQELPGSSGIIGLIGDKNSSNCFLLRGDMDALPIKEETGLSFASQNGNMHACGHDVHTTVLLGAAALLKEKEDQLHGTVKLLFQPGEEIRTDNWEFSGWGSIKYHTGNSGFTGDFTNLFG